LLLAAGCSDNLTVVSPDAYESDPIEPLACVPNLDGRIDFEELSVNLDASVSYLVSPDGRSRSVDVAGSVDAEGHLFWDWSEDEVDDQLATFSASSLSDQWYVDSFPDGQFTLQVDAAGRIDGVYVLDEDALWLLGLASSQSDPPEGRTLMVYESPVPLYRLPLTTGDEWVAVGEVRDAVVMGLPYAGRDVYEVRVDAAGVLMLPDLTFTQAHRVRTHVTVEPAAGVSTSQRQVGFLFECFGEVARATSLDDEPAEDFTVASEVRRLSLLR